MRDQGPLQRGFTTEQLIGRTQRHTRRRSCLVPAEGTRQGTAAGIDHDVADLGQAILLQLGQRRRRVGFARQTEHASHQRADYPVPAAPAWRRHGCRQRCACSEPRCRADHCTDRGSTGSRRARHGRPVRHATPTCRPARTRSARRSLPHRTPNGSSNRSGHPAQHVRRDSSRSSRRSAPCIPACRYLGHFHRWTLQV
jgi:hypothetical protein